MATQAPLNELYFYIYGFNVDQKFKKRFVRESRIISK